MELDGHGDEGKGEKGLTKKDLKSIGAIEREIEGLNEQIKGIESSLEGTAIQLREAPSRSTREHDPMAAQIAKLIELKDRRREAVLEKGLKLESMEKEIESLPSPEREIVYLRYVERLKWWQVAQRVDYAERHCKRLAASAEKKLCGKT